MKELMKKNREIRRYPADRRPLEFNKLWADVFEDEEVLIDSFFLNFSEEIRAYGLLEDGKMISGLTQFLMGKLVIPDHPSPDVLVSYAICTDPAARGSGAGSAITSYAIGAARNSGAVSVLSPAEESLVNFYEPLGYRPLFPAAAGRAGLESTIGDSYCGLLKFEHISAAEYNELREKLLAGRPHIALSENALNLVKMFSADEDGFYSVNRGAAAVVFGEDEDGNPLLQEISVSPKAGLKPQFIADNFANRFRIENLAWRAPASGAAGEQTYTQGMIAADPELIQKLESADLPPYFGFPFD